MFCSKHKEFNFVFSLLTGNSKPGDKTLSNFDYEFCYRWLKQNELIPFFVTRYNGFNFFPDNLINEVKVNYENQLTKMHLILNAYSFIKSFFAGAGVPFIPLKGIDFAFRYYEDPYLRSMSDLDIMIEQKDLGKVIAVLKASTEFELKNYSGKILADNHHVQVALKGFNNFLLEIHWRYKYLCCSSFFENCLDKGRLLFSDEMNLCITAVSFFTSKDAPLRYVLDACQMLSKTNFNFEQLFKLAEKLKCKKRLIRFLLFLNFLDPDLVPGFNVNATKIHIKLRNLVLKSIISTPSKINLFNRIILRFFLFENFNQSIKYMYVKLVDRLTNFARLNHRFI